MTEFDKYETEWEQIRSIILDRINNEAKGLKGEQKKSVLRQASMEIEEAEEIVDQMEIEAKGKAREMMRVRECKASIKQWKVEVSSISAVNDRTSLLSTPGAADPYGLPNFNDEPEAYQDDNQRSRLLTANATIDKSSQRLDNSQRLASESESVGNSILQSLWGQRSQLENTIGLLDESDGHIDRSHSTLKKMLWTAKKQKYMTIAFGFFFVLVIIFSLYLKFR